jgi:putative peptide maturation system protein
VKAVRNTPTSVLDAVAQLLRRIRGMMQEDALAHHASLQRAYPNHEFDLVWYGGEGKAAPEYEMLVTDGVDCILRIGSHRDTGGIWVTQSARRWDEQTVVRVDGESCHVTSILRQLDFVWSDAAATTAIVDQCLIRQEVRRRKIDVSDSELQELMDQFRLQHGLYTAEQTLSWLAQRGLTFDRLEAHLAGIGRTEQLKEQIAAGREHDYFDANRAQFERVCGLEIFTPDVETARRLSSALRKCSLVDAVRAVLTQPYARMNSWSRWRSELSTAEAALLFGGDDVVGPTRHDHGFSLYVVACREAAQLNQYTIAQCREELFRAWLRERRDSARVEWVWDDRSVLSQNP